ncbi:unnamed protein product [Gordionus sp. m RMFG-2023]
MHSPLLRRQIFGRASFAHLPPIAPPSSTSPAPPNSHTVLLFDPLYFPPRIKISSSVLFSTSVFFSISFRYAHTELVGPWLSAIVAPSQIHLHPPNIPYVVPRSRSLPPPCLLLPPRESHSFISPLLSFPPLSNSLWALYTVVPLGHLRAQCARSGRRSRRTRTSRRVRMRRSELAGENTAGQREELYGSLYEEVESRMKEQRVASVQTTRDRRSNVGEEESAEGREVNGEQEQLALEQMRGAVVETVQDPDETMAWEELMRLGEI